MMSIRKYLASLIVIGATLSNSLALNYQIGEDSSVTANTGAGLQIRTELSPSLSSVAFNLNNGQTYSFDFFKIWTDELTVDADDMTPKAITATLDFDVPDIGASVHGLTVSGTIYGYSAGIVVWFDPVTVTALDRVFTVNLNNAYFDLAQGGLGNSPATIRATVKQISSGLSSIPVPEAGSTVVLLVVGLGIMLMGRRFPV